MKRINRHLIILFSLVFLLSSCVKLNEGEEIEFEATFENSMDVNTVPKKDTIKFSGNTNIDPNSNEDFAKYIENIENIEILSLWATVDSVSENFTMHEATFKIYSGNDEAIWNFDELYIALGETIILNNETGQWEIVQKIINKKQTYFIQFNGIAKEGGAPFRLIIINELNITANIL